MGCLGFVSGFGDVDPYSEPEVLGMRLPETSDPSLEGP